MTEQPEDLLQNMITALQGLQEKSVALGRANLACLIDLARSEAEDELNTSREMAGMRHSLKGSSIVGAWR